MWMSVYSQQTKPIVTQGNAEINLLDALLQPETVTTRMSSRCNQRQGQNNSLHKRWKRQLS